MSSAPAAGTPYTAGQVIRWAGQSRRLAARSAAAAGSGLQWVTRGARGRAARGASCGRGGPGALLRSAGWEGPGSGPGPGPAALPRAPRGLASTCPACAPPAAPLPRLLVKVSGLLGLGKLRGEKKQ